MSKTVYERFLQSLYHPEPVRDLRELVLRARVCTAKGARSY